MNQPLLPKNTTFTNAMQTITLKLQILKTKNNQYQRMSTEEFDEPLAEEMNSNRLILQKQIQKIKEALYDAQNRFKQPQQKGKIKDLKKQFEKQRQRNRAIMKNIMEKSIMMGRSVVRESSGKNNNYFTKKGDTSKDGQEPENYYDSKFYKKQNSSILLEEELDFQAEHRLAKERGQEIGNIEKRMNKVQEIYNDTAQMVRQQGQHIDIIGQQMHKAQANVQQANQQLDSARQYQKKAKKKYIILIFVLIIIVLTIVGLVVVLT